MTRFKRIIVFSIASLMMLVNNPCVSLASDDIQATVLDLSSQQRNAINMLNYLRALSQEIRSSSNSRLFLEEAYSSLINNTNPNAVDSQTLDEVMFMLDTLQSYRMIDVKRERLQYIYEQNQAQALRSAVPNPLGMISLSNAFNPGRLAANIVYMAIDSVTSYQSAKSNADLEFLKDGWALDDEESRAIHESRKDLYQYMVNMSNAYDLHESLTLNEESIDNFVAWCNNDNVLRKIQNFEANKNTYQAFGPYWLELAKCYYENKDYQKCLDAINEYEALDVQIFRKDYNYAEVLPLGVAAAFEVLDEEGYVTLASDCCQKILNNTNDKRWNLRYFAGQTYCDLYEKTGDKDYLQKAFQIELNNVNYLLDEQRSLTDAYCADVKKIDTPKGATKQVKNEIQQYNN